jgi:carboxypeptidase family protein
MRAIATVALLCALSATDATTLRAQQTASLAIHVVDASDAPVAGARLEVVGTRFAGLAGADGWVRLEGLPVGPALLRISRIGYAPLETSVPLAAGAAFEADVELASAPVAVPAVAGSGEREDAGLAAGGFYRRKRGSLGVFLTEEDFERAHVLRTVDIFRAIAGVRVAPMGRGGHVLLSARYRCPMSLYLNGVEIPTENIDGALFENLGAVEVYRGPTETPPEFARDGSPCGAVAMWTRTGGPRPAAARPRPAPARQNHAPTRPNPAP